MKTTKLIFPLVLALAATLATTGCRHKPVGVTKLPGQNQSLIGEQPPTTLPPGNPINPGEGIQTGGGPMASAETFDNMLADRAALAAYTIHFAYDSSVIRSSEKANLNAVAQALSDPSAKLLIEGNCDERGTEEYNRSLGERRALAAREALAKLGVDPMRVPEVSARTNRWIPATTKPPGRKTAGTISCSCIRRRERDFGARTARPRVPRLQFVCHRAGGPPALLFLPLYYFPERA
jgi:outer membrane protein OmpA-like peptidoglycan-associated protein